ncbi:peptidase [Sphaerisporangium siamense]|uniref:Dipeptidyl-peptidase-4 n=1 Tax=Sphaerisporangium siamense TaxID=795645 RepID=A0A7W7DAD2_9ACTN|nr:prolyl oligopeptidase family serine peptidase [Sphaerisporangium siamense]MBB4701733.1 dipeptidyl-peptidase-4 [Sphaerisporangium siamense]GII84363.1 peptidase [Sphaerisporangium siamense]
MTEPNFPRQFARTRRFRLGTPRRFAVSPDGGAVTFIRTGAGDDPVERLWILDVATGEERLVADPATLEAAGEVPEVEKVRRERSREQSGGIVAYATDAAARVAAFALSGRLYTVALDDPAAVPAELDVPGPVVDPRPDPSGTRLAYVAGGALRVVDLDGTGARTLAAPDGDEVVYGLAEHIAAEEMGRDRGFWWSPDGSRLLVARVDDAALERWYISDPADPAAPPRRMAYPQAGKANSDVTLWLVGLDGSRVAVDWDREAFEYVVSVFWGTSLLVTVQSRDQRTARVLRVDPGTGATTVVREDRDPAWVEIVRGTPALTASGALVWAADSEDTRRLVVGGEPVTPPGLQVGEVLGADGDTVLFAATDEPTERHLWTYSPADGVRRVTTSPGVYEGVLGAGTLVVAARSLAHDGVLVDVHREGRRVAGIASLTEKPVLTPRVELMRAGERELRTAVLFPSWHVPGSRKLPVLMDPYGGPATQLVVAARTWWTLVAQWFAEQGFAVVVADGRGTPNRGPAWERTVWGDLATPVLEDQVAALRAAAERHSDLDLSRVGIRGWSFGGFLAALAVLRRPDVFHAAVAGAAPTDQGLYDTYWKERYLGHPDVHPDVYRRTSLIDDAPNLTRPLMLIQGLADDNVVAAHTLRLSAALTAAGRPHTVLPLTGVTHMVAQDAVAENLLHLQLDFLKRSLGM